MAGEPIIDTAVDREPHEPIPPEEVTLVSVSHLFVDIRNYNDQFSLGRMMARGLLSHLRDEDSFENASEHQLITAEALSAIHQGTLNRIGLSLEPVHGGATFMAMGAQASSGEIRVNVSDGNRFTFFLRALQPQQIEATGLKPNLEDLSGILAQQVLSHYDLKEPSDETLQLLGNLGNIVDEYKRLGMGEAVLRLETYLQHARQGDLREFVLIERNGYLSEPGRNFGPADWEKDTTPEGLEARWTDTLNALIMTRNNPQAQALYQQLGSHLLRCLGIAREFIRTAATSEYHSQEIKDKMDQVLEEAAERLKSITADQNPTST